MTNYSEITSDRSWSICKSSIQGSSLWKLVRSSARPRSICGLSTEMNSPYAMVGGVVFGPDQSDYHGGHGDHGRFTDGVSVDVSKRTEVTNNVRAASMRPKRRDRERRRCIFFSWIFFFFFFWSWSVGQSNEGDSNVFRTVEYFFVFFFFSYEVRFVKFVVVVVVVVSNGRYTCIFSGWSVVDEEGGCRRMWRKEKNT